MHEFKCASVVLFKSTEGFFFSKLCDIIVICVCAVCRSNYVRQWKLDITTAFSAAEFEIVM